MRIPKMRTRSSTKLHSGNACEVVNNNLRNNTIAMSEKCASKKYKGILGSREPIVLLTDCIMADEDLIENIPLQRRKGNSKFIATCNKARKTVVNSKDNLSVYSHLSELLNKKCCTRKPSHKKTRPLTKLPENRIKKTDLTKGMNVSTNIKAKRTSGSYFHEADSGNSVIIDPLGKDQTAQASLKEAIMYDQNSNVIGITNYMDDLHNNNLTENADKGSAATKDVEDEYSLPGVEQNVLSNERQMQGIVCRNDDFVNKRTCLESVEDYADKADLQPENRSSGHVADHKKATQSNATNLQDNLKEDNLILNAQNGDAGSICVFAEEIVRDKCKSSGNANFLRQKGTSAERDANNKAVKRIKINRKSWVQDSITKCIDTVNADDCVTKAADSNTKEVLPEIVISDISKPKTVVGESNQNVEKDHSTSDSTMQNEIRTFGGIEESVQNCPQGTVQPKATTSAADVLSKKNPCSISEKENEEEAEADEFEDCISLYADSLSFDESDTSIAGNASCIEKPYRMTKDVIKNYYKRTQSEFNELYNSNDFNNQANALTTTAPASNIKQRLTITTENFKLQQTFANSAYVSQKGNTNRYFREQDLLRTTFRGYCYASLTTGIMCNDQQTCTFRHDFRSLIILLYNKDQQYLFRVLHALVLKKHTKFIITIYTTLVVEFYNFCNINCVLKIFKKLYELKVLTDKIAYHTIESIRKSECSIKIISDELANIVNNDDTEFVNWILKRLKDYIAPGEYWQTLRSLLLKSNNLQSETVEIILQECSITGKDVQDININIMRQLCSTTRLKINRKLLSQFITLTKHRHRSPTVQENYPVQYINQISSPTQSSATQISDREDIHEHLRILSASNAIFGTKKKDDDKNTQHKKTGLTMHPIDNLPKPYSAHGRRKFWKFYVDVYSLHEGLKHNDYKHVLNILNAVKKDQQSAYTRACYHILSKEIKYSQYRLTKLVSQSVQIGATPVFFQIIVDVAIYILINLTEKNLWVLAYKLLTDMEIILKVYISSHKFDAITIMLFAEIYLANQQAEQAFILLKQANIICTDSKKWKTKSNVKDSSIRVQIITLLLDVLRETFPEHAFFLFKFLVADQCNHFQPIDLVRFANKMVTTLLLKNEREMIIDIARLIIDRNFTLNRITYRALISELVHLDMDLAKQLYGIAIALGIYSKVQFHPTTYIIINSDWTREEMYLATLILMQQLLSHIGHAIECIRPEQFPLYFIFENIWSQNQFRCNRWGNQRDKKIEESKVLMETVLHEEFNPPISVSEKENGKICKLDSLSVLNYLRCVHRV